MNKQASAVHLFLSPVLNESRLLKVCNSTINLGLVSQVTVIGTWEAGLQELHQMANHVQVIRIKTISKTNPSNNWIFRKLSAFVSFMEYCFEAYKVCRKLKPAFISCHNVVLLPLSVVIKLIHRTKLFYEPHELETERTGLGKSGKFIAKIIEKILIRRADKVVTVCEPITEIYKNLYNLRDGFILTIQNAPINPAYGSKAERHNLFREEFNIPEASIIYIYQGVLDEFRGIKNYLETFSKLDDQHHLVLMGYGVSENIIRSYCKAYKNIHFKPSVPVDEIIKYTSSADVGMFILPGNDISLSYRYSLPNKFFEYAIAGLHICVSDNLELLSGLVKKDNLGTVISSAPNALYDWITGIKSKSALVPNEPSIQQRMLYGWQNEETKYIPIYRPQLN